MFPTKLAPGIRSLAQSIWILLLPIPHFFEISVVDRYFIGHLTNQLLTNAYNVPNFIIVLEANKVNLDVMPFPDSWTQIRFFLRIIPTSLLGKQCQNIQRCLGAACWEFPNPLRSHLVRLRVSPKRWNCLTSIAPKPDSHSRGQIKKSRKENTVACGILPPDFMLNVPFPVTGVPVLLSLLRKARRCSVPQLRAPGLRPEPSDIQHRRPSFRSGSRHTRQTVLSL